MKGLQLRLREIAATAFFLLGIGLLGWGVWPAPRSSKLVVVALADPQGFRPPPDAGASAAGDEGEYTVALEYPRVIRRGDTELVHLRVTPAKGLSDDGLTEQNEAVGEPTARTEDGVGQHVALQARLELSGADVAPDGDITASWSAENGTGFLWTIRGLPGRAARGTAWIFRLPVGSPDLAGDRMAVSAQPLEIGVATFLGLTGQAARVVGAILLVLATALGMPRLDEGLRRAMKRRRPQGG